jgi:hypothetical protein
VSVTPWAELEPNKTVSIGTVSSAALICDLVNFMTFPGV